MRIISGKFKGRRFYPPAKKWPTRPTTDYAKEGLFNMLMNEFDFEDLKMLDLFGGTGNHCYEFISRGSVDVTYVDKFGPAVKFVHQISKELDVSETITIVKSDVFKFIKSTTSDFDYIFAGPPYPLPNLDEIPDILFSTSILRENGLFVLEHDSIHDFSNHPNFVKQRNYGSAIFAFFRHLQ
jgi:16S rRNA (guanine(966)-N(2))-methyltransferase RsmD